MRKEYRKSKKRSKRIRQGLIALSALFLLSVVGYIVVIIGGMFIVDEDQLSLDTTTVLVTKDGEEVGNLYEENREIIPIENIPEHLQKAFVAIEDRRFYEHGGVDIRSIARAAYKDILAMSKVEGASTLTQQLAKNLFLSNEKTWTRKIKEVMAAIQLERQLTKDEIMELYLNEIYFGEGLYGVENAANHFFSKSAEELTVSEGALLAGMAKGPNGYSPIDHPEKALDRRNIVLQAMRDEGYISHDTLQKEKANGLGLEISERTDRPWVDSYVDLVMKEAAAKYDLSSDQLRTGGYQIIINMDKDIQKIAYEKFQNDVHFPGNTEGVEGAFIMNEVGTGNVVAALGGRTYELGNLNRVTVDRQPGSTFKPVAVYGPALMHEDGYKPFSPLPDYQTEEYGVTNADGQYDQTVTLYEALIQSKNTSVTWLLDQIGIDYSKEYLEKLGMPIEDDGLHIALGGLTKGVTPLQMAQSYQAFATGGEFVESITIDQIIDRNGEVIVDASPEKRKVFSPQVAWNITAMLQETVRQGTATAGNYSKALAGKTGTTQHPHVEGEAKDIWFVGYTPEYVSSMWMGYDKSDEDHYLTGSSSSPTALTKEILTAVDHAKDGALSSEFTKPDDVDPLPEPIILPEISNLAADYDFGGFTLVKGTLTWDASDDERVEYRIYQDREGAVDKLMGKVSGETSFSFDGALFRNNAYYVVPYDPISGLEGSPSETVELEW